MFSVFYRFLFRGSRDRLKEKLTATAKPWPAGNCLTSGLITFRLRGMFLDLVLTDTYYRHRFHALVFCRGEEGVVLWGNFGIPLYFLIPVLFVFNIAAAVSLSKMAAFTVFLLSLLMSVLLLFVSSVVAPRRGEEQILLYLQEKLGAERE